MLFVVLLVLVLVVLYFLCDCSSCIVEVLVLYCVLLVCEVEDK